jgi:ribosomal protein S1
VPEKNYV